MMNTVQVVMMNISSYVHERGKGTSEADQLRCGNDGIAMQWSMCVVLYDTPLVIDITFILRQLMYPHSDGLDIIRK